jgi:hypothetical protein
MVNIAAGHKAAWTEAGLRRPEALGQGSGAGPDVLREAQPDRPAQSPDARQRRR